MRDTRAATRTSGSDQVEEEQAKVVGLRAVLLSEQQQHQQRGKGLHLPSVGS